MVRTALPLSRAIDGFLLHKAAEGRSQSTLASYRIFLGKLLDYLGNVPFQGITLDDLRGFFAMLGQSHLSPKSVRNIHLCLSSFYNWAVAEGLHDENPIKRIVRPKAELPAIQPFTKDEINAILKALARSDPWRDRPTIRNKRPTATRDRAIVLMLLDTGLRASELCGLTVGDFDQVTGHVVVRRGKGGKARMVLASKATGKAVWRYLLERTEEGRDLAGRALAGRDPDPTAPLFVSEWSGYPRPMTRGSLLSLLKRAGDRAGVPHVHPHRFRHTFAIEYLRNGGDIYTLQSILGHSSLEMVRRYLAIVQDDLDAGHRAASPVTNWRL